MKIELHKLFNKCFLSGALLVIFLLSIFFQLFYQSNFLVQAEETDVTPPQITSFNISPETIDTSTNSAEVTITMTLTDDLAGVCIQSDTGEIPCSSPSVRLRPYDGSQYVTTQIVDFYSFTRESGDDKNGIYTSTATIPVHSMNGEWRVGSLFLNDKLGNYQLMSGDELLNISGIAGISVNNVATIYDVEAPQLTAFNISPTTIDTSTESADVTVTMTLTDDMSGVCVPADSDTGISCGGPYVRLSPFDGSQYVTTQAVGFFNFTRESGDNKNGVYISTATVPAYAMSGEWRVEIVNLSDNYPNYRVIWGNELPGIPGVSNISVSNIASFYDFTPPQVASLEINPTNINTANQSQSVLLTVSLTDDMSGVCTSSDCGTFYNSSRTQLLLQPHDGSEFITTQSVGFYNFTRIVGDDKNGVYTAEATFPEGSYLGTWKIRQFLLVDKIGNYVQLDSDEVASQTGDPEIVIYNNILTPTPTPTPAFKMFNVSISKFTKKGAFISWETSENANSRVDFGTSVDYDDYVFKSALKTSHFVKLNKLVPGSEYHFMITSVNEFGESVFTGDNTFIF